MRPETRETRVSGPRRRAGGEEGDRERLAVEITVPMEQNILRTSGARRITRHHNCVVRFYA